MKLSSHALLLVPAVLVATAFTAQPALAASQANVPFDFIAAGQLCPAGSYTVSETNHGTAIELKGAARNLAWVAGPGEASPTDQRVLLVFDQEGNHHVLRSVQYRAIVTNRLDNKVKETIPAPEQVVSGN